MVESCKSGKKPTGTRAKRRVASACVTLTCWKVVVGHCCRKCHLLHQQFTAAVWWWKWMPYWLVDWPARCVPSMDVTPVHSIVDTMPTPHWMVMFLDLVCYFVRLLLLLLSWRFRPAVCGATRTNQPAPAPDAKCRRRVMARLDSGATYLLFAEAK